MYPKRRRMRKERKRTDCSEGVGGMSNRAVFWPNNARKVMTRNGPMRRSPPRGCCCSCCCWDEERPVGRSEDDVWILSAHPALCLWKNNNLQNIFYFVKNSLTNINANNAFRWMDGGEQAAGSSAQPRPCSSLEGIWKGVKIWWAKNTQVHVQQTQKSGSGSEGLGCWRG